MFENRRTGRLTFGQWPNAALWTFIGGVVLRSVSDGDVSRFAGVVATIALAVWAVDEILRGVNPFRRALGAVVLLGMLLT